MFAVKATIIKISMVAKCLFNAFNQFGIGSHYFFGLVIRVKYRDAQHLKYFAYGGFAAAYITCYPYFKHYFLMIKSIFGGSILIIRQYGGKRVSFTGKVL